MTHAMPTSQPTREVFLPHQLHPLSSPWTPKGEAPVGISSPPPWSEHAQEGRRVSFSAVLLLSSRSSQGPLLVSTQLWHRGRPGATADCTTPCAATVRNRTSLFPELPWSVFYREITCTIHGN